MRVCLTGGIACGKSLVSRYLGEAGFPTVDADDIVHELIPAEERRVLARRVFSDPAARRELEARLHPEVKRRIEAVLAASPGTIAVIPLLFEVHWEREYDIICAVVSSKAVQISRMMATRGYSREEALSRIAAQMDAYEKAEKSDYVIENDGTPADLKAKTFAFADWLRRQNVGKEQIRGKDGRSGGGAISRYGQS